MNDSWFHCMTRCCSEGRRKGFTLTELLVVVVMAAIGMAVFYTVFLSQWVGLDYHLARSDMWQELNKAVEEISFEVRHASFLEVQETADGSKSLILKDVDERPYLRFRLTPKGDLLKIADENADDGAVITTDLDVARSTFEKKERNVVIRLVRTKPVLFKRIAVDVSTEISPRN